MRSLIVVFLLSLLFSHIGFSSDQELLKAVRMDKDNTLTTVEKDQILTRGWRDRRKNEIGVLVSNLHKPSDYIDNRNRGTVEFRSDWGNYSWHKVKVKDGTILNRDNNGGCNFSQMTPNSDSFFRGTGYGHNLTFINCNMTNVRTYDDWILENCNTNQVEFITEYDENLGDYMIVGGNVVAKRSKDVKTLVEVR